MMSDLTDLIHLMDVKGKRLPGDVGRSLFHDHWDELRAGLLKADAEIERLKQHNQVFDAMSKVGLIQYGDTANRCYSVWGFHGWSHDESLLDAIEKAAPQETGIESDR